MQQDIPDWLEQHRCSEAERLDIDSLIWRIDSGPCDALVADVRVVRSLVVEHPAGLIQLLAPLDGLVDLEQLGRSLGQRLRVRIPTQLEETFSVCAVPGTQAAPVILEETLGNARRIALATGDGGYYLLEQQDLSRLIGRANPLPVAWKAFCQPLPESAEVQGANPSRQQIHASLSRFTELRVQQRLDETLHIPPLPEAARRIVALESDPDHDLADLTAIIETDASLAARIMGWANSAYYGLSTQVSSLDEAIMRVLGFEKVKGLALGLALSGQLNLPAAHVRGVSPYWLSSVYSAATMEALVGLLPVAERPPAGLAYLAGLLSNFGTLVLGHVFPPHYARICMLQESNRHLPHAYLDQSVLGLTRDVLCASLLESWQLPEPVTDAVRYQNSLQVPGAHASLTHLLQLTHQLLASRGVGDYPLHWERPGLTEALQLTDSALYKVLQSIDRSAQQLDEMAQLISA